MKILLYLIYGEDRVYHLELTYSILSAWQYLKDDPADIKIILACDAANQRPDLPVDHLLLSADMLADWSMQGTYFHAVKLHAVHHALLHYDAPLAFVDTDTMFKAHPKDLFERFNDKQALMHACEGPLHDSAEWDDWARLIASCNGQVAGRPISGQTLMRNAGIYGLMPEHAPLMQTATTILHDLLRHGSVFTSEQLAASIALGEHLEMAECRDLVEHYWHGPRAYFHYQLGQMFPDVRSGGGVSDTDMPLPHLRRHIPSARAHKIAARLKRLQRRESAEFEFAYRAYLGARAASASDPELANVWALTALNTLIWGMQSEQPPGAHLARDFVDFTSPHLDAQSWMTAKLQARWRAFWSA